MYGLIVFIATNQSHCSSIYNRTFCPNQSIHLENTVPIIESQGFFRLSNSRKQGNREISTPLVCVATHDERNLTTQKLNTNKKLLNTRKHPGYLLSPKIGRFEIMGTTNFTTISEKENIKATSDLRTKLNDKEIEVLDLRNEKMKLEMIIEEQRKNLIEKDNELDKFKKKSIEQTGGSYSNKIQKLLKVQQETHNDTLSNIKKKVSLILPNSMHKNASK